MYVGREFTTKVLWKFNKSANCSSTLAFTVGFFIAKKGEVCMKLTVNDDVKVIVKLYQAMDADTKKAFVGLAKTFCKDHAKENINERKSKETGTTS